MDKKKSFRVVSFRFVSFRFRPSARDETEFPSYLGAREAEARFGELRREWASRSAAHAQVAESSHFATARGGVPRDGPRGPNERVSLGRVPAGARIMCGLLERSRPGRGGRGRGLAGRGAPGARGLSRLRILGTAPPDALREDPDGGGGFWAPFAAFSEPQAVETPTDDDSLDGLDGVGEGSVDASRAGRARALLLVACVHDSDRGYAAARSMAADEEVARYMDGLRDVCSEARPPRGPQMRALRGRLLAEDPDSA
jgi:hypothetical protein